MSDRIITPPNDEAGPAQGQNDGDQNDEGWNDEGQNDEGPGGAGNLDSAERIRRIEDSIKEYKEMRDSNREGAKEYEQCFHKRSPWIDRLECSITEIIRVLEDCKRQAIINSATGNASGMQSRALADASASDNSELDDYVQDPIASRDRAARHSHITRRRRRRNS